MLTRGSERSPLRNAWVTSHVVAETHWGSRAEHQPPPAPSPWGEQKALQAVTCRFPELLGQPVPINVCFAQSSEFTCELKRD